MSRSRLVAPLIVGCTGLRKRGPARQTARAVAQADLEDVNFGWWALAAAFAFIPCVTLAIATDALGELLAGWDSPSALGTFLMLSPWALASWFVVRWAVTTGSAKVTLTDDVGVVIALLAVATYALAAT